MSLETYDRRIEREPKLRDNRCPTAIRIHGASTIIVDLLERFFDENDRRVYTAPRAAAS